MSTTRWVRTPCGESVACVEIGKLEYGDFAIRNSNFKSDKVIFTRQEIAAFIRAAKNGHFDRLFEVEQ